MYKTKPLLPKREFYKHLIEAFAWALGILSITIIVGTAFYHYVDGESWLNANLNAVMIMTGLGLEDVLHTDAAKVFTSFYAIISTIIFFIVLGIIFSPIIRRFLHKFHLDLEKD